MCGIKMLRYWEVKNRVNNLLLQILLSYILYNIIKQVDMQKACYELTVDDLYISQSQMSSLLLK